MAGRTSLRFTPPGVVHACCVNSRYTVGDVRVQTVREIWDSTRRQELATALDAHDFSLGCQECGDGIAAGQRELTYAPTFDPFEHRLETWPRRLEFAISDRCNLMCVQCSGEFSSAIRTRREGRLPLHDPYGDAFFDEIKPFLAEAQAAVFLGGEPFLARSNHRLWDLLLQLDEPPVVQVTTNGTVWNERVAHYIEGLQMQVAVSLDAVSSERFEEIRVGASHHRVMQNVREIRKLTSRWDGGLGINACILTTNWTELDDLLLLGDELDADVNAIVVTEPPEFSLLRQRPDDLRRVVDVLQARTPEVSARLGRNAQRWHDVLQVLTGHLDGHEGEVAVASPGLSEASLLARMEEAHRAVWGSDEPLVEVRADGGRVTRTWGQPWAEAWDVDAWVGSTVESLPDRIGQLLGGQPRIEITPIGSSFLQATVTAGASRVEVVVGEWVERGERHLRLLVGPPATVAQQI